MNEKHFSDSQNFGIISTIGPCRLGQAQAFILGKWLKKRNYNHALVGSPNDLRTLRKWNSTWTLIETENPLFQRGFESKLYVHKYSPFAHNLFLDVDLLPLNNNIDLRPIVETLQISSSPVAYFANLVSCDNPSIREYQGTQLSRVKAFGLNDLWTGLGGGHYYWQSGGQASNVFESAADLIHSSNSPIKIFSTRDRKHFMGPDEVAVSLILRKDYPQINLPDEVVFAWPELYKNKTISSHPRASFLHFYAKKEPVLYSRIMREQGFNQTHRLLVFRSWIQMKFLALQARMAHFHK